MEQAQLDQKYDEAIAFHEAGKTTEAIQCLEALASMAPEFTLAHSALSFLYGKHERYEEAVRHAKRASELEPNDPFSFVALSLICQKAGQIREAEQAAMAARQLQSAGGTA